MLSSEFTGEFKYLTPTLESSYERIKPVDPEISETPETSLYYLYEGRSKYAPYPTHTIRAFNFNSKFAKENFDAAATLFIKELLHLMSIDPKSVLVNSFEIHEKKMAFAALPYAPLSCQIQKKRDSKLEKESKEGAKKPPEFSDTNCIENMISDLLLDVEFLSKEMNIKDCSSILVPKSIYQFKKSGAYFLGDWLTPLMSAKQLATETGTNIKKLSSIEAPKEMFSLGLSILELNKFAPEVIQKLREMDGNNQKLFETTIERLFSDQRFENMSKEWNKLLRRMACTNVKVRPEIEEFFTKKSVRRKKLLEEDYRLEINLAQDSLNDDTLEVLIKKIMTKFVELSVLDLKKNRIADKGVIELGQNTSWKNLTTLNLFWNNIGAEGAIGLGKNTSWMSLTTLNLERNHIGAEGAIGLGKNTSWTNFTTLNLERNHIDAAGAIGLGKNTSWMNLATLNLSWNNIGAEGAIGLGENTSWIHLETLNKFEMG